MSGVSYHYLLKYIIIGDPSVGKSNLLLKYAHNKFTNEYQATIGVEFGAKNLTINGKIFRIQIWDTAGQENFKSITRAYYKNSVCAIVTYDITKRTSFENVQEWIDEVKSQSPKQILLVLVGNKIDLENERVVSKEEGEKFAYKYHIKFFESSAKNKTNVKEAFNYLIEMVFLAYENEFNTCDQSVFYLDDDEIAKSNVCCFHKNKN